MPSFKPKTNKKVIVDEIKAATLDTKHTEMIDFFNNNEKEVIPELNEKINTLRKSLNETSGNEKKKDIREKLNEVKLKRKELVEQKKRYYLDNSKYIFDYFEDKKNIGIVVKQFRM